MQIPTSRDCRESEGVSQTSSPFFQVREPSQLTPPIRTIHVAIPGGLAVTAVETAASGAPRGWVFIYAPGAGSSSEDPFGVFAAESLAAEGITAVRFQFPYMEAGRRSPDRTPVLEATWTAVIQTIESRGSRAVVGGRSMGGRIASQVVAQGARVDALVLFAYPLHPPGDPSRLRDRHLPDIGVPTLFCSGTRDSFGSPAELEQAASNVRSSRRHLLDGADHGFGVLKRSGRSKQDVWREAVEAMVDWLPG